MSIATETSGTKPRSHWGTNCFAHPPGSTAPERAGQPSRRAPESRMATRAIARRLASRLEREGLIDKTDRQDLYPGLQPVTARRSTGATSTARPLTRSRPLLVRCAVTLAPLRLSLLSDISGLCGRTDCAEHAAVVAGRAAKRAERAAERAANCARVQASSAHAPASPAAAGPSTAASPPSDGQKRRPHRLDATATEGEGHLMQAVRKDNKRSAVAKFVSHWQGNAYD